MLASLVGTALHAALVLSMTQASAFALHLRWRASQRELAEVGRQAFPLLLSSLVASGGLLVDQAMAAMLPAGSVAALVFAGRFVSVALVLLGGAISSAITPYLSAMAAKQDWQACRDALRRWTRMSAAISLPIAVALMTGAHGLVRATLQHGAFGARDTAAVAPVLAMSALQIPFFVVSRVHYRLVIAMRRTDVVLWCGTINLILDVALNLLLMRWLGVAGIALATSLWTVSTWLFLWLWAKRLLERADRGGL